MKCPSCGFEYTYEEGDMLVCSACQFKWEKNPEKFIIDANGNKLFDGDSVIVIKDLKVRGSANPIKQGTKIDNIKIQDPELNAFHNISCRVEGFGQMDLKSEFVKKV